MSDTEVVDSPMTDPSLYSNDEANTQEKQEYPEVEPDDDQVDPGIPEGVEVVD